MYLAVMRNKYERQRVSGYQRATWAHAGRASLFALPFGKAGYQQYRDGLPESESAHSGSHESLCKPFLVEVQRTSSTYFEALGGGFSDKQKAESMNRGRKADPLYMVNPDLPVHLIPTPEPASEFRQRRDEVQKIIVQILLLGKKRGRPAKREEIHEEAA